MDNETRLDMIAANQVGVAGVGIGSDGETKVST